MPRTSARAAESAYTPPEPIPARFGAHVRSALRRVRSALRAMASGDAERVRGGNVCLPRKRVRVLECKPSTCAKLKWSESKRRDRTNNTALRFEYVAVACNGERHTLVGDDHHRLHASQSNRNTAHAHFACQQAIEDFCT